MCHQSLFGPGFVLVSGLVPDGLDFIVLLAGNAKVVVLCRSRRLLLLGLCLLFLKILEVLFLLAAPLLRGQGRVEDRRVSLLLIRERVF